MLLCPPLTRRLARMNPSVVGVMHPRPSGSIAEWTHAPRVVYVEAMATRWRCFPQMSSLHQQSAVSNPHTRFTDGIAACDMRYGGTAMASASWVQFPCVCFAPMTRRSLGVCMADAQGVRSHLEIVWRQKCTHDQQVACSSTCTCTQFLHDNTTMGKPNARRNLPHQVWPPLHIHF